MTHIKKWHKKMKGFILNTLLPFVPIVSLSKVTFKEVGISRSCVIQKVNGLRHENSSKCK